MLLLLVRYRLFLLVLLLALLVAGWLFLPGFSLIKSTKPHSLVASVAQVQKPAKSKKEGINEQSEKVYQETGYEIPDEHGQYGRDDTLIITKGPAPSIRDTLSEYCDTSGATFSLKRPYNLKALLADLEPAANTPSDMVKKVTLVRFAVPFMAETSKVIESVLCHIVRSQQHYSVRQAAAAALFGLHLEEDAFTPVMNSYVQVNVALAHSAGCQCPNAVVSSPFPVGIPMVAYVLEGGLYGDLSIIGSLCFEWALSEWRSGVVQSGEIGESLKAFFTLRQNRPAEWVTKLVLDTQSRTLTDAVIFALLDGCHRSAFTLERILQGMLDARPLEKDVLNAVGELLKQLEEANEPGFSASIRLARRVVAVSSRR